MSKSELSPSDKIVVVLCKGIVIGITIFIVRSLFEREFARATAIFLLFFAGLLVGSVAAYMGNDD